MKPTIQHSDEEHTFFIKIICRVFILSVGTWGQSIDRRGVMYILALGEMLRRIQWNIFRLENEHANNCGQFRAIKEIPLPYQIDSHASPPSHSKYIHADDSKTRDIEVGEETDEEEEGSEGDHQGDEIIQYSGREYDTRVSYSRARNETSPTNLRLTPFKVMQGRPQTYSTRGTNGQYVPAESECDESELLSKPRFSHQRSISLITPRPQLPSQETVTIPLRELRTRNEVLDTYSVKSPDSSTHSEI
jgi:hypothetical protein